MNVIPKKCINSTMKTSIHMFERYANWKRFIEIQIDMKKKSISCWNSKNISNIDVRYLYLILHVWKQNNYLNKMELNILSVTMKTCCLRRSTKQKLHYKTNEYFKKMKLKFSTNKQFSYFILDEIWYTQNGMCIWFYLPFKWNTNCLNIIK